ncbi:MAG: hypothetical protein VCA12_11310 [Pseudomonadales bacterium]|jgi:hypothetical protein
MCNPKYGIGYQTYSDNFFWTASVLENRLREYQCYNNENRCQPGWAGGIPMETRGSKVVDINDYRWKKYCRGLFQLPLAA